MSTEKSVRYADAEPAAGRRPPPATSGKPTPRTAAPPVSRAREPLRPPLGIVTLEHRGRNGPGQPSAEKTRPGALNPRARHADYSQGSVMSLPADDANEVLGGF